MLHRYKKREHSKIPLGKKGKIVWDEGANPDLIKYIHKTGWEVKRVPKSSRNISMKDPTLAMKYTDGRLPLFTNDYTSYSEEPLEKAAVGYVEQEPMPADTKEYSNYTQKIQNFFFDHYPKDIRDKVWHIPVESEPFIKVKSLDKVRKKKK
ncbi:MAG TPA: hypothetical protein VMR41_04545 [Patescibacteria group bacterium]|nr:hypothetical protein [Patescibacteria group bacterium]